MDDYGDDDREFDLIQHDFIVELVRFTAIVFGVLILPMLFFFTVEDIPYALAIPCEGIAATCCFMLFFFSHLQREFNLKSQFGFLGLAHSMLLMGYCIVGTFLEENFLLTIVFFSCFIIALFSSVEFMAIIDEI
jgi:hypothetical protein